MNIIRSYPSVGAFCTYLDNGTLQDGFDDNSQKASFDFTGTRNFEDADRLCKYGDEESRKLLTEACGKLQPSTDIMIERKLYKTGYLPCVGAYLTGRPNNMWRKQQVEVPKRVITIYYYGIASWYYKKADIALASAKLLSAIIKLENSGMKVNMYMAMMTHLSNHNIGFLVKIKDSAQRLNLVTMAYPVINPSMLRRHYFRWVERTPNIPTCFNDGYGKPYSSTNEIVKALTKASKKCDCCLSMMDIIDRRLSTGDIIELINQRQGEVK